MNKILLGLLVLCSFSLADNNCSSVYKCKKIPNKDFPLSKSDLNCTLPSPNTNMTITALDVFEFDGKR